MIHTQRQSGKMIKKLKGRKEKKGRKERKAGSSLS